MIRALIILLLLAVTVEAAQHIQAGDTAGGGLSGSYPSPDLNCDQVDGCQNDPLLLNVGNDANPAYSFTVAPNAGMYWESGGSGDTTGISAGGHGTLKVRPTSVVTSGCAVMNDISFTCDDSAAAEITSTTQGFMGPRLTTTQRDAIVSPVAGLQIYNSDLNLMQFYNGSSWLSGGGSGGGYAVEPASVTFNLAKGVKGSTISFTGFDVSATSTSVTGAGGLYVRYGTTGSTLTLSSFNSTPTSATVTGAGGLYTRYNLSGGSLTARNLVSKKILGTDSSGNLIDDPGGSSLYIQNQSSSFQSADSTINGFSSALSGFQGPTYYWEDGNTALDRSAITNIFIASQKPPSITGARNIIGGYASGGNITSGNDNTCLGYQSCDVLTTAINTTALGSRAGIVVTTGQNNSFLGKEAGSRATVGWRNTLVGSGSGTDITTGGDNTCVGDTSCNNIVTGSSNTAVGVGDIFDGGNTSASVYFGYLAGNGGTNDLYNSIAIGYKATVTSSNTAQIGGILGSGNEVELLVATYTVTGLTLAQFKAATPRVAGQLFYCSDCTTDGLAVSTGATRGGFSRVTSKTTALNSSGSGSSDFLSTLVNTPHTVGSSVTLTSSDYGTLVVATNSVAAVRYTITLPDPSTHANQFIGIQISTFTSQLVYISTFSADKIDGAFQRVMWAGESAILRCDGSNWFKVSGKSIPMQATMFLSTTQNLNDATVTVAALDTTFSDNTGYMASASNNRIKALRPGPYTLIGSAIISANTGGPLGADSVRTISQIQVNGAQVCFNEAFGKAGGFPSPITETVALLATGDYVQLGAYQQSGVQQGIFGGAVITAGVSQLIVTESPSW